MVATLNMSCNCILSDELNSEEMLWNSFSHFGLVQSTGNETSKSRCRLLIQLCFDYLLAASVNLKYFDISYCFSNSSNASSICDFVTKSLRVRQSRGLPALDTVVVKGLEYYLSTQEVSMFESDILGSGGTITLIL